MDEYTKNEHTQQTGHATQSVAGNKILYQAEANKILNYIIIGLFGIFTSGFIIAFLYFLPFLYYGVRALKFNLFTLFIISLIFLIYHCIYYLLLFKRHNNDYITIGNKGISWKSNKNEGALEWKQMKGCEIVYYKSCNTRNPANKENLIITTHEDSETDIDLSFIKFKTKKLIDAVNKASRRPLIKKQ